MKELFRESETKNNLMAAFAGESQARNRYTFGAAQARNNNLFVIEQIFTFTANQEKEHAEIFYDYLCEMAGKNILVNSPYPVDIYDDMVKVLRAAQNNEYEEHNLIYKNFGDTAIQEGFSDIGASFYMIAKIEKTHGDRFKLFADLLEQERLFASKMEIGWMCLNCGHHHFGKQAPRKCPVCHHDQGYFIRLELAPFHR